MNQKKTKYTKICTKLQIGQHLFDRFRELIMLLYYILSFQHVKSTTRKLSLYDEIEAIKNSICDCLNDLNFKDDQNKKFKFKHMKCYQEMQVIGNDMIQSEKGSAVTSNQTYSYFEQIEDVVETIFSRDADLLIKQNTGVHNTENSTHSKSNIVMEGFSQIHKKFYDEIIDMSGFKDSSSVLSFIRNSAILLLRQDMRLDQNDPRLEQAVREMSDFFELPEEMKEDILEFLLDINIGHPLDVFKVCNKRQVEYSLKKDTIIFDDEEFDQLRLEILSDLLGTQKQSLKEVFVRWYHQFRYFEQAKESIKSKFLSTFEISEDFIKILAAYRHVKTEENDAVHKEDLQVKIKEFISRQLMSFTSKKYMERQKLVLKQKETLDKEKGKTKITYTVTDQFFGTSKEGYQFQISENALTNEQQMQCAKLLDPLLKLKNLKLDKHLSNKLFNANDNESRDRIITVFKKLAKISADPEPHQLLNYLRSLSTIMPPFEVAANWDELFRTTKATDDERVEFITLNLIINATDFTNQCQNSHIDLYKMSKSMNKIIELCEKRQINSLEDKEYNKCIQTLHDINFLADAQFKMIRPLNTPFELGECQDIIGFLMGYTLGDQKLIRESLLELLREKEMRYDILEGIIAVLQGDIEAEHSIQSFCHQLDIEGQLVINLMDLIALQTKRFPSIIIDLFKTHEHQEETRLCASFCSLINGDLSSIRILAQKLEVPYDRVLPVCAAALGDMQILSEFYSNIQVSLGISNQKVVRYLMQLSHGHTQCITRLANFKSEEFLIHDVDLTEAIFRITYIGQKVQVNKTSHHQLSMMKSIDIQIRRIVCKIQRIFNMKSDDVSGLIVAFKILIKASWNDVTALVKLVKKLEGGADPKSIWRQSPSGRNRLDQLNFTQNQKIELLKDCLQMVLSTDIVIYKQLRERKKYFIQKISDLLLPQLMPSFASQLKIEEKNAKKKQGQQEASSQVTPQFSQAISEITRLNELSNSGYLASRLDEIDKIKNIDQKEKETLKNLYKLGCTFGISLYKMFKQPFFKCFTCKPTTISTQDNGFCLACAVFCHSGHDIEKNNDNLYSYSYCDCGDGIFNYCPTLNDKNPIPSLLNQGQQKSSCSVCHQQIKELKSTEDDGNQQIVSKYINKGGLSYTLEQFYCDVNDSFKLPKYFCNTGDSEQFFNELISRSELKQEEKDTYGKEGVSKLWDLNIHGYKSFAENIILLGKGEVSQSFLNILCVKNKIEIKDFDSDNPFIENEDKTQNFPIFQTLNCLVTIAQNELEDFLMSGHGLAAALGQTGTNEMPAVEKLSKVLLLAQGGDLPLFTNWNSSSNLYSEMFKNVYGVNWKSIIVLHKILTLSKPELIKIFSIDYYSIDYTKEVSEYENIRVWAEEIIYEKVLELHDTSIQYCNSVIGVICRHAPSFDFIAQEKDIHPAKAKTIKALVFTKEPHELITIFKRINWLIPVTVTRHLMLMLRDSDYYDVIRFLVQHVINKRDNVRWAHAKSIVTEKEIYDKNIDDKKHKDLLPISEYFESIINLMAGDDIQDSNLDYLKNFLEVFLSGSLTPKESGFIIDDRLLNAYQSVQAVFSDDSLNASLISKTFNLTSMSDDLLYSILSLMRGGRNQADIEKVMESITVLPFSILDPMWTDLLVDCEQLLLACHGDIVSMAYIADKLIPNDSHILSFISSLVTGRTKFDNNFSAFTGKTDKEQTAADKEKTRMDKNILLREMYRIFEKASLSQFKKLNDTSQIDLKVDEFVRQSFTEKVPLYFTFVLTNDASFVNGLFDVIDHFKMSLKTTQEKDQEFLSNFIEFLNPFNSNNKLKPILDYLISDQSVKYVTIGQFNSGDEMDVEIQEFFDDVFMCMNNTNSESTSEIIYLFESYMVDQLSQFPGLQQNLSLLKNLIAGEDVSDNLDSFVELILSVHSYDSKGQQPNQDNGLVLYQAQSDSTSTSTAKLVSKWLQAINLMLDKDKLKIDINGIATNGIIGGDLTDQGPLIVKGIEPKLQEAVLATMQYFDLTGKQNNAFAKRAKNVKFVVDVIRGLVSLAKGDLQGIKPLASKLGGFPLDIGKLDKFIKVIKSNKGALNFKSVANIAIDSLGDIARALPTSIPGGDNTVNTVKETLRNAMDDPASMFDPKLFFMHFANSRGTMGFEEFSNIFKQLGLKVSNARMLQLFSAADQEKRGELTYPQFVKALHDLKTYLISEIMEQLGFSIQDIVVSFVLSISILMLLFAFIFVGIAAFSPITSFSSVTNSFLPIGAGLSVNMNSDTNEKKPEQLADEAEDRLRSKAGHQLWQQKIADLLNEIFLSFPQLLVYYNVS